MYRQRIRERYVLFAHDPAPLNRARFKLIKPLLRRPSSAPPFVILSEPLLLQPGLESIKTSHLSPPAFVISSWKGLHALEPAHAYPSNVNRPDRWPAVSEITSIRTSAEMLG